jgi:hypothetical protein
VKRAAGMAAVLLLTACGKRGDPLPPLPRTPQPVAGFTVSQRAGVLEVVMVAPQMTTGGVRLGVMELELLRLDGPGELDKAGKKQRFRAAPGERIIETFPLPPVGTPLKMAARAVHRGQTSLMGKLVSLVVQPAPPPPPTLAAQLRPTGVLLTWTMPVLPSPPPPPSPSPSPAPTPPPAPASPSPAPPASPAASPSPSPSPSPVPTPPPPPRVRLYRRAGESGGEPALLVPEALAGTSFEDAAAAQGQEWCYVARLVTASDPLVESANSPEACLEVKDVFPPAVPTGLSALLQDTEVEVSWSPSSDADLKAYRLYRASGGGAPQRVAEVEVGKTSVRDTPAAGAVHVYTLTAVDQLGNESAPSAPAEVRSP